MRVLVCGGRDYYDRAFLWGYLDHLGPPEVSAIISGMATGADTLAARWGKQLGIPVYEFHADWNKHKRAAGPIRNQRMLDEGKPDLVIAFPGGRGTADMVRRARAAGVRVEEAAP